jgi:hypothetical protein
MKFCLPALLAVAAAGAASAQQHQNAYLYSHYDTPATEVYSLDQYLRVDQKAEASFWPVVWKWEGQSFGGYFGLQTNGSGPSGEPLGDTLIFSLWDANAVDPSPGSLGGTFGGEGTGYTLRSAYPIRPYRFYRLRIWRLSSEAEGNWWGAWTLDTDTNVETYLGRIRSAPEHATLDGQSVENFSEYFGLAKPTCDDVPVSVVRWGLPFVRSPHGDVLGSFTDSVRGSCTGGGAVFQDFPPPWNLRTHLPGRFGLDLPRTATSYRPDENVLVTLGGPI